MQKKVFNNSPLAIKLLLVPMVAALSFSVYLIYSSIVLSDANTVLSEFRDIDYPILDAAEKNRSSYEKVLEALHTAAATGEIDFMEIARASAVEMSGRYDLLEKLDTTHQHEIRKLKVELQDFFDLAVDIAQRMANKDGVPSARQISTMRAFRDQYLSDAVTYRLIAEKDFHQDIDREIAKSKQAQQWGIAIGSFMLAVIALLTWIVTRGILTLEKKVSDKNKKLVKVNNELEQELKKFKEAEEAKLKAESANKIKDEFLANMSHELRTPMHAVIGFSHLCLQTQMTPKQQDYLQKIHAASHTLLEILNDILDISKIEAGKMVIDSIPFDLEDIVSDLTTIVSSKAQEKLLLFKIEIANNLPTLLIGDPLRLGQILVNLAGNAVKFTDKGEVTVRAELESESEENVVIRFIVTDTGIGMRQSELEILFRPFTQADNSITRKFGGTGLGLSISRHLAELMNGKIEVKSTYGAGSQFIFTASFQKDSNRVNCIKRILVSLRGLRVLVVTDEGHLNLLKEYLGLCEFNLTYASNTHQAQVLCSKAIEENSPFKLIVLTQQPHQIDGSYLSRWFESIAYKKYKPKIILVAEKSDSDVLINPDKYLVNGILAEPLQRGQLLNLVAKLLDVNNEPTEKFRAGENYDPNDLAKLRGARILLVEDNEINRQVAKELLEGFGVTVTTAENGEQAIACLNENKFDAVLMDMQMPVMDGITATREIRMKPSFTNLPVIALTANVMLSEQNEILAAGMNDHIGKPIYLNQLVATLAKWIHPGVASTLQTATKIDQLLAERTVPNLGGVNVEESLQRIGGDINVYYLLLNMFRSKERDAVARIREAISASDYEAAERLAHTLRGILGSIGAESLEAQLGIVENNLKHNMPEVAVSQLVRVEQELCTLIASIDLALSNSGS